MTYASTKPNATILLATKNDKKEKTEEEIVLRDFIDIKGWKSTGNKLTYDHFVKISDVEVPEEVVEEPIESIQHEPLHLDTAEKVAEEAPKDVVKNETSKEEKPEQDSTDEDDKKFTTGDQINLL